MEYKVKMIIAYLRKEEVLVLKLKGIDAPIELEEEEFLGWVSDGSRYLDDIAGKVPVMENPGVYTLTCDVVETHTGGWSEPEEVEYSFEFVGHELLYKFPKEW